MRIQPDPTSTSPRTLRALRASTLALACLVSATSCDRRERLEIAELQPRVDARVAALEDVLELAAAEPDPGSAYEEYIAAAERFDDVSLYVGALADEPDSDGMADALLEARGELEQERDRLRGELALSEDTVLDFRYDGSGNAETFFVAPDGAGFEERNPSSHELLLGATHPARDLERSRRVAALEYALVLREVERQEPSQDATDEGDLRQYKVGYMVCDAFLFRLEDRQLLRSYRFTSGSYSPTVTFGLDIALPSDPEIALAVLGERLWETAHLHAPAALAEMTDGVLAEHRIDRSFLGEKLEWAGE